MNDFVTSDGEVFGSFARSPSDEFLLIWRDECNGGKPRTKGRYYLFQSGKEVLKGALQRPNDGQIANNGSFVFCDWLFTDKLASAFYAFDRTGQILIEKKFRANLANAAISSDGTYAACQTLMNPESSHGELLTLFDLKSRKVIWQVRPPFCVESYGFDLQSQELTVRGRSQIYNSCTLKLIPVVDNSPSI